MKSPGHRKWPDHEVKEKRTGERYRVEVDGEIVADTRDAIVVEETNHPKRVYFPRSDVKMDKLARTEKTTECPFKGHAHHFSLRTQEKTFDDAVWTYEDPYEEHLDLKDRVAFYDDEIPAIHVVRA